MPPQPGSGGLALAQAIPTSDPSDPAVGETIERLRDTLPASVYVGGAVAENHDLEAALAAKTPLVIGVVLVLGFLLLLVALQAPLIAALGVATNLLATGAAFGVGRLIFQDGRWTGLLGYESQGFLDAWAPVFFFAMIFAISMDYTVFLLASAKEHYDRTGDPREAAIGGLAHSGRVIFAAAAVMVAVFFTFALSGPLPPKEMGVILGIAVLLDAMLIRLVLMPTLLRVFGHRAWARAPGRPPRLSPPGRSPAPGVPAGGGGAPAPAAGAAPRPGRRGRLGGGCGPLVAVALLGPGRPLAPRSSASGSSTRRPLAAGSSSRDELLAGHEDEGNHIEPPLGADTMMAFHRSLIDFARRRALSRKRLNLATILDEA